MYSIQKRPRPRARIAALFLGALLVPAFALADSGDSAPRLISTTDGKSTSASAATWHDFASLQKAADAGNPDALYELGERYLNGSAETPKNATRAVSLLDDAAKRGNRDANFRLGKLYSEGAQVTQDYPKALQYYTAAARAGDPVAQHNLGGMYAGARGTKANFTEALAWISISAKKNPDAAESEKKLRAFLSQYRNGPALIAKGETRARELEQELASPQTPISETPRTSGIQIAPPKIAAPAMQMPPPSPVPPQFPTPQVGADSPSR